MDSYQWLKIRNHWTKIFHHGSLKPNPENITKLSGDSKILVILLTGNPGVCEFYEGFLTHLCKTYKSRFEIDVSAWTVSHAGHTDLPPELAHEKENTSPLLHEQILHKREFFDEYVPKNTEIYLIGHSIGCYMILKLLPYLKQNGFDIQRSFMLFPTIESMHRSDNGKWFLWARSWGLMPRVPVMLAWLAEFVPQFVKENLVSWRYGRPAGDPIIEGILNVLNGRVLGNVLNMAFDELELVVDPRDCDDEIAQFAELLVFYYGEPDPWCGSELYYKMSKDHPKVQTILCGEKIEHAMVLKSATVMAEKVVNWM